MFPLVYLHKCPLCRRVLSKGEQDLCNPCKATASPFGVSLGKYPHLAKCLCLWYYKGKVPSSIHRFKFQGFSSYGRIFGRMLSRQLQREHWEFDLVSWVPVHPSRLHSRGYDQAKILAKHTGKGLGVPVARTLVKGRNNQPQSMLDGLQAKQLNVKDAYRCTDPEKVSGKRILLLDDVITTGATAGECARTLLQAGAKEVSLATVAAATQTNR